MTFMMWNPAWETGIPRIDEQHQQLLAQFEGLMQAIHENHSEAPIPDLLAYLAAYVEIHFAEEERHMQATHYPGYLAHKAIHDDLRGQVMHLLEHYQRDPSALTEEVVDFLTQWLIGHINEQDRSLARFLLGREPTSGLCL